jgi:hypothetical protein
MGLLSTLFGSKPAMPEVALSLQVDLGSFKCSQTALGARPDASEPYAAYFDSAGVAKFNNSGVELSTKQGVLDCVFITLANFTGTVTKNGSKISISAQTTPEDIISNFGEPYWTDTADEEMILFYEFQNGRVELQFEFPDRHQLGFITLCRDGVLSGSDQRKAYGVTKEWPPK